MPLGSKHCGMGWQWLFNFMVVLWVCVFCQTIRWASKVSKARRGQQVSKLGRGHLVLGTSKVGAVSTSLFWYNHATFIGACLSKPHAIVFYGNTCIDRPCLSHSHDTDTIHMPTLLRHVMLMCVVVNNVVIATKPRTLTVGKQKAETPMQQTARLEWERDQWTSSYLCFLSVSPFLAFTYVSFLAGHFTQSLFHTST